MSKDLKVSIIVAVHNEERFIGRCLRSLIRQDFDKNKYEIIVVNDGSTDKTSYALDLFQGDIKLVNHAINKGLPSAVNTGIKASLGEYVVRVDSDDYVNEHFVTILSTYLDFNFSSSAVCCDYFLVDEAEKIISRKSALENPIACGVMFRKELMEDVGLMNEKFLANEEKEFRRRFEKKYNIDHISFPLYRYRRHRNNMTNNEIIMKKYDEMFSAAD